MAKYKTLKEIHKFLIDNDLFHKDNDYLIKKKILLRQESNKQDFPSLSEKSKILTNRGEIY